MPTWEPSSLLRRLPLAAASLQAADLQATLLMISEQAQQSTRKCLSAEATEPRRATSDAAALCPGKTTGKAAQRARRPTGATSRLERSTGQRKRCQPPVLAAGGLPPTFCHARGRCRSPAGLLRSGGCGPRESVPWPAAGARQERLRRPEERCLICPSYERLCRTCPVTLRRNPMRPNRPLGSNAFPLR